MQETQETRLQSPGQEEPLEEETAAHSSILVWKIPWPQEPGSHSPGDRKELETTKWLSIHTYTHTTEKGGPRQTPGREDDSGSICDFPQIVLNISYVQKHILKATTSSDM